MFGEQYQRQLVASRVVGDVPTPRGVLVAMPRSGKWKVFPINPLAPARDRDAVSRKKSDPGDALILANILRIDMHTHGALPDDTDLGRAIAVRARAQQDCLKKKRISDESLAFGPASAAGVPSAT